MKCNDITAGRVMPFFSCVWIDTGTAAGEFLRSIKYDMAQLYLQNNCWQTILRKQMNAQIVLHKDINCIPKIMCQSLHESNLYNSQTWKSYPKIPAQESKKSCKSLYKVPPLNKDSKNLFSLASSTLFVEFDGISHICTIKTVASENRIFNKWNIGLYKYIINISFKVILVIITIICF
jgi:hypothetical protein